MAEYIEREGAEEIFAYGKENWKDYEAAACIAALPAADVAPVRHGRWGQRWICSNMSGYEYACSCSECGKPTYRISTLEPMPPYCQMCGAKMDISG